MLGSVVFYFPQTRTPAWPPTCYIAKDDLELLRLLPKCWVYHVYTIYPASVLFNWKPKLECKMIFLRGVCVCV